jgi:hypothetical protein
MPGNSPGRSRQVWIGLHRSSHHSWPANPPDIRQSQPLKQHKGFRFSDVTRRPRRAPLRASSSDALSFALTRSTFPVKVNTIIAIEYDAREADVERQSRAFAAHKDGASRRHYVPDAELIEHVGVLEGEIDQYDCFIAQCLKHIDVDNLRAGLLVRSNRRETRVFDGTLDDDTVNFVEIEVAPRYRR